MGIQLDWEIEAENKNITGVGEDPDAARKRRVARLRMLVTIGMMLVIVLVVIALIRYRIHQVESHLEQTLRDTVVAEVTALRLGDLAAFESFQRSATGDWLQTQRALFNDYQDLLQKPGDVRLTGHILEVTIEDPRARVHIQEIIEGVPYTRIWFYWRYKEDANNDSIPDGWRHVPFDATFWGDPQTHTSDFALVSYNTVDEAFATHLGDSLEAWLTTACRALPCEGLPRLHVEVVSNPTALTGWLSDDPWRLRVVSPYITRARSDMPFSPEIQIEIASLLAEQLTLFASNNTQPMYLSDAYYLQQAVISWLTGQFVALDTHAFLMTSLADRYGESVIGQMLHILPVEANIGILTTLTGVPLDEAGLDWRDFFTWRLQLENDLILRQNINTLLTLYDIRDEALLTTVYLRMTQPLLESPEASVVRPHGLSPDGLPQQVVTVRLGAGDTTTEMQVLFRLVNNNWIRAS